MPLTGKGEEIKSAMEDQYGSKKGEQVFYASKNAGTITGVDGAQDDQNRDEAGKFSSGGGGSSGTVASATKAKLELMGEQKKQHEQEGVFGPEPAAKPNPAPKEFPSAATTMLKMQSERSNAGDEYVAVDNAATAIAGDEPPPQEDLPSQEDPNTVPDTEGEGDPEGAGKALFSNMPWPGRHL